MRGNPPSRWSGRPESNRRRPAWNFPVTDHADSRCFIRHQFGVTRRVTLGHRVPCPLERWAPSRGNSDRWQLPRVASLALDRATVHGLASSLCQILDAGLGCTGSCPQRDSNAFVRLTSWDSRVDAPTFREANRLYQSQFKYHPRWQAMDPVRARPSLGPTCLIARWVGTPHRRSIFARASLECRVGEICAVR